jgi:hypothetical protein
MAVFLKPKARQTPPLDADDRASLARLLCDEGVAATMGVARMMADNPANWPDED